MKHRAPEAEPINCLWQDKKRHLGLPLSFTTYRLSEDRIFQERGFLNIREDEVLLYRVRDIQLKLSFFQRIFGVGTVSVISTDKSIPILDLVNVKDPRNVKELIFQNAEACKNRYRVQSAEVLGENTQQAPPAPPPNFH